MTWVLRRSLALTLLLIACAGMACGGTSDEELAQAKEDAAREARLEERQKQQRAEQRELKREIDRLKRKTQGSGGGSSGGTPSPPPSAPSSSGGRTQCGDGVSVGPNTSCPFGHAVKAEFLSAGSENIEVYSPTTGKRYAMNCSNGTPTVCRGGNNASVYFD